MVRNDSNSVSEVMRIYCVNDDCDDCIETPTNCTSIQDSLPLELKLSITNMQ